VIIIFKNILKVIFVIIKKEMGIDLIPHTLYIQSSEINYFDKVENLRILHVILVNMLPHMWCHTVKK